MAELPSGTVTFLFTDIEGSTQHWARDAQAMRPALALPIQATPFVGREREVAAVREQLLRPEVRLLTLTGPGGTGKTRLALQAAADLQGHFEDGVSFVSLAPISDPRSALVPALVTSAIAEALGVREAAGRPLVESLKAYLHGKELLLVLDNFEQVVVAGPLVAELLQACPRLKIMVTSRAVLHVYGEHDFAVPPMRLPERAAPPGGADLVSAAPSAHVLTQSEAVRLFIERARAAKSDFRVTDDTAPAVAEICRRLDGLPLALELAAARVKLLPPRALLARLSGPAHASPLPLLTGGGPDRPVRHQTLRATIGWSHDLLSREEQVLFRRLAPFVGGWTLGAAEAVCAGDGVEAEDIVDLLGGLLDNSLIVADEWREESRYRLLQTIRDYALERLREAGEESTLRRRHAAWCLDLAERAAAAYNTEQEADWFDRLEAEHDNARAALHWITTAAGSEDADLGLRLGSALATFWSRRGFHREGRDWLARLFAYIPDRTAARARALIGAGHLAARQGDHSAARALLDDSLALARDLGDSPGIAAALRELGMVAHAEGDYPAATALLEEGLALARQAGDGEGTSRALQWLADLAYERGEHDRAAALHEEGRAVAAGRGDKHGVAYSLRGLGYVALAGREHDRAADLLRQSLTLHTELRDRRCAPMDLEALACVAGRQGAMLRAARLFGAARAQRDAIGVSLPRAERSDHDRGVAAATLALGEEAFARAWAEGLAMTMDEAIRYGLADEDLAPGPASPRTRAPAGASAGPLSPREREVARLIARGLTSRQIAEALVIAETTAERHVANIFAKLGSNSRAQVAVWAAEHGLLADDPA